MNRVLGRLMLAVLALTVAGYAAFQAWRALNIEYETMAAVETPIDVDVSAKGVAVRTETVLCDWDENISFLYADGTHVSRGMPVGQPVEGQEDITDRMLRDELERELASLETLAGPGETVILQADSVARHIYESVDTIAGGAALGELSVAQDLKYDILTQLNRRSVTLDEVVDFDARAETLRARIEALGIADAEAGENALRAPDPGYFCKTVDGYEEFLTPGKIEDFTVDDFVSCINGPAVNTEGLTVGASGPGVAKVITGHIWQFAAVVSEADAGKFSVGRRAELDFGLTDQKPFAARVSKIVAEESGARSVIVFDCDVMSPSLSTMRAHKVDIALSEVSGYKLPISCKRFIGTQLGVYVLDTTIIKFKPVEVLYENEKEGYTVLSTSYKADMETGRVDESGKPRTESAGLNRYDEVIIGGRGLENGKVLKQ